MSFDPSIYQEEAAALAERPRGGGERHGSFKWLNMPKPSREGQEISFRLRLLPRLHWTEIEEGGKKRRAPDLSQPPYRKWWVRVDEHRVPAHLLDPSITDPRRGKRFVALDDMDKKDWKEYMEDPINILKEELRNSGNEDWIRRAKEISTRARVYANVLDGENNPEDTHWYRDTDGSWQVNSLVWSYPESLHAKIVKIGVNLNCSPEDPELGRDLMVTITRIGRRDMDIRYGVMPLDPSPIPEQLMPITQVAHDLENFATSSSREELARVAAAIDPRGRGGVVVPVASPRLATAPPPAPAPATPPPAPAPALYHVTSPTGEQLSPMDMESVRGLEALVAGHQVWQAGWPAWQPASEILGAVMPPPAPPPSAGYVSTGGYTSGQQSESASALSATPSSPAETQPAAPPPPATSPQSPPLPAPPPPAPTAPPPQDPGGLPRPPGPPPGGPGFS